MNKLFERIFWHNGTAPALNETNLNAMSKALDDIDNRVCELGAYAPETKEYAEATKQYAERVEALAGKDIYTEWHGTHEAFEQIKDQLEDGAIINFTDDNEPLTDAYDDHLDETSINAVQNRVLKQEFDKRDIVVVNGKSPNNTYASLTQYAYPSGFNLNNSIIVACQFRYTADGLDFWQPSDTHIYPQLRESSICIYGDGTEKYRNLDVKIFLRKM